MKNKTIIRILVSIVVIVLMGSTTIYAGTIDRNSANISYNNANQFDEPGSIIISTIRVIGMIISVGALMIIGIRYMLSSVEEKALQKESMIFYVIGAILTFAIVYIASAVYEWTSTL